jgi:Asp-tRNA(Asn)/Glu-tRNA(Gln) amidotransferase A subunit family amidase
MSEAPPCPTARSMAEALTARTMTSVQAVQACLDRIAAVEPAVNAWMVVDAEGAMEQAKAADKARMLGDKVAALAGLPIAVKDNIETADLPTGYGSEIYDGHRPRSDAACVAQARNAGAVMLGKTVTTEFAYYRPGKTSNPHHPDHTPGGSSQGSAAAVGAGMVPLAFGTQTAGSVIRPASYCGVVGYKPSWGTIPRIGVKVLSDWLDTVGVFARDVEDAAFFVAALTGRPGLRPNGAGGRYTVAILREPYPGAIEAETVRVLDHAMDVLEKAGHTVFDLPTPPALQPIPRLQRLVMAYDMDKALGHERRVYESSLSPILKSYLDEGRGTSARAYDAALATTRDLLRDLDPIFGKADVILSPSAAGEAPKGLHATGDPAFNRIWTQLQLPCLNVPAGKGPNGLPVGVTLAGRTGQDAVVLAAGAALEAALKG